MTSEIARSCLLGEEGLAQLPHDERCDDGDGKVGDDVSVGATTAPRPDVQLK